MQYLWINPVSAGMCEEDSLKRFLERHGLTRVECRGDWGRIVRERYEASLRAGVTLADARCPEAVRLLEEIQKESENESGIENLKVAPIEPILLHCARELSTRPDLADGEKIITTPCQSLAVLGNSLGLENTRFIAWNRLAGGEVRVRAIEDSPIPPGYFAGICRKDGQAAKVESVSSPEKIRAYCAKTGQPVPQTDGALIRCVLESLAMRYRQVYQSLKPYITWEEKLYIMGGGAQNQVLNQFTANALGIPVITGASEATAVGNIMEQLYALGAYRTREEKCNILAASFDTAEYLPQDTAVWDEAYRRFEQLYQ